MNPTNKQQVTHSGIGKGEATCVELTKAKIGLVIGFFFVTESVLLPLLFTYVLHLPAGGVTTPEVAIQGTMREAANRIVGWLNIVDFRVALVTSVLLYYPFSGSDIPAVRRVRRGETFTGIVNLYIIAIAATATLVIHFVGDPFDVSRVISTIAQLLVLSAAWCLIGFHLCEGRILFPLGGVFLGGIAYAFFWSVVGYDSVYVRRALLTAACLVNLLWQLWGLLRYDSGFSLFPSGLWPALKACAPVYFVCAASFCMFTGRFYRILADSTGRFLYDLGKIVSLNGNYLWELGAYLLPLALLSLPAEDFDRRSRRLIFITFALYVCLSIVYYPFWGEKGLSQLMSVPADQQPFHWGGKTTLLLIGAVMSPGWRLIALVVCMRWWVRGSLLLPLVIPMCSLSVLIVGSVFPESPAGEYNSVYFTLASQVAIIVSAIVLLVPRVAERNRLATDYRKPAPL